MGEKRVLLFTKNTDYNYILQYFCSFKPPRIFYFLSKCTLFLLTKIEHIQPFVLSSTNRRYRLPLDPRVNKGGQVRRVTSGVRSSDIWSDLSGSTGPVSPFTQLIGDFRGGSGSQHGSKNFQPKRCRICSNKYSERGDTVHCIPSCLF